MHRFVRLLHLALSVLLVGPLGTTTALAQTKKPNILVIWGDDIGTWNITHNNRGMMGYQTPNISRIAKEGVGFTDYYAPTRLLEWTARASGAQLGLIVHHDDGANYDRKSRAARRS